MRTEAAGERSTIPLTSVAVDVGGGYGALVVQATGEDLDREVEVENKDGVRQHAVVHHHAGPSGPFYGAVFPSLEQGAYALVDRDGSCGERIQIEGGRVSEAKLE
jgi:hypothetical protein